MSTINVLLGLIFIFFIIGLVLLFFKEKNEPKKFFCYNYLYDTKINDNLFCRGRYYNLLKETDNFYFFRTDQGNTFIFTKERNNYNKYIKDYFQII